MSVREQLGIIGEVGLAGEQPLLVAWSRGNPGSRGAAAQITNVLSFVSIFGDACRPYALASSNWTL